MKTFGVVARIKPPVGYTGLWVNIYKYGKKLNSGGAYKTRVKADAVAKTYRYDCIFAHIPIDKTK